MTDHAAEAQRHLRELTDRISNAAEASGGTEGTVIRDNAPGVTACALLAIAHTLQAIHEALTTRTAPHAPNERCGEIRPGSNAAHPCILAAAHLPITRDHTHIDADGDMW